MKIGLLAQNNQGFGLPAIRGFRQDPGRDLRAGVGGLRRSRQCETQEKRCR